MIEPVLMGEGPATCSSTKTLARIIVIDANGYYRTLGVDARAGKRDMMLAYHAQHGERSVYLTYIIKLLLDPERRRAYDLIPLGSLHIDPWIERDIRRAMAFREMSGEPVDLTYNIEQDAPPDPTPWRWAWYRWGEFEHDPATLERLEEWQAALLSHLPDRPALHFAVGLHDQDVATVVRRVGYRLVAFLRADHKPRRADAKAAALALTRHAQLSTEDAIPWLSHRDLDYSKQRKRRSPSVAVSRAHSSSRSKTATPSSPGS